ncbi:adenine nucleotide alpha hydrolase family protein [Candidatus Woesearchaeota archaeon]|nr:adenine nucleotide alpha hydrolase family protein [Candidatus Woesearchaeota archaeon]
MKDKKKHCLKCEKPIYCSNLCHHHFMNYFERKIIRTILKFNLFSKKDRVAVAVSGGKDSTVCLYVLKKLGYNVEAITVDVLIGNYTKKNLDNIRKVCKKYNINLHEVSFKDDFGKSLPQIESAVHKKGIGYSSCTICGVLRRYLLNKYAKKLGFDCICTGHNLDDEAQAFVMNIFRNDLQLAKRQGPITGAGANKSFVNRVKPLYLCTEKETTAYSRMMKFPVNYGDCPCREGAYRKEYADMLDKFEKKFSPTKYNIISFFLRTIYNMKDETVRKEKINDEIEVKEINACQYCGEPCSKEVCKRCEILIALKK